MMQECRLLKWAWIWTLSMGLRKQKGRHSLNLKDRKTKLNKCEVFASSCLRWCDDAPHLAAFWFYLLVERMIVAIQHAPRKRNRRSVTLRPKSVKSSWRQSSCEEYVHWINRKMSREHPVKSVGSEPSYQHGWHKMAFLKVSALKAKGCDGCPSKLGVGFTTISEMRATSIVAISFFPWSQGQAEDSRSMILL